MGYVVIMMDPALWKMMDLTIANTLEAKGLGSTDTRLTRGSFRDSTCIAIAIMKCTRIDRQ